MEARELLATIPVDATSARLASGCSLPPPAAAPADQRSPEAQTNTDVSAAVS